MAIREITAAELAQLTGAEKPLLVDFVKVGCPWCERLQPELERIDTDWGERLDIVKLWVDEAPALAVDYGLRGTPALLLLRNGQCLGSKHGFQRAQQLHAFLQYHLK